MSEPKPLTIDSESERKRHFRNGWGRCELCEEQMPCRVLTILDMLDQTRAELADKAQYAVQLEGSVADYRLQFQSLNERRIEHEADCDALRGEVETLRGGVDSIAEQLEAVVDACGRRDARIIELEETLAATRRERDDTNAGYGVLLTRHHECLAQRDALEAALATEREKNKEEK